MLGRTSLRQIAAAGVIVAISLWASGASCSMAQGSTFSYAPTLLGVGQLARFRPVAKVGSFSSYDRTGHGDDGHTGKYSFLRKEGRDGLVIAETSGPGAITRIWTPTPLDAPLEFYFDGEATPRLVLPFKEVFTGKAPPFVGGLTGHGVGGYYSYVPLEFAKSLKVIMRAEPPHWFFYMVNYVIYEHSVAVRTFTPGDSFQFPMIPTDGVVVRADHVLPPGKTVTLFETLKPGRIQSLRLGPAEAFAGKRRDVVLRMYWDGAQHPAVEVPVGDFFGYSFGQPATRSLLFGTDDRGNYIRFPMPFAHSARIELASQWVEGKSLNVVSEVVVADRPKAPDEGTFHAEWRRENPTTEGRPFTYLDVRGRGQLVGLTLQAQVTQPSEFEFEGNDEATIDDEVSIHGTGTEDSFNGGYWGVPGRWFSRVSLPFSGCLEYDQALGRSGGYRLFLTDAYSFRHALRYTLEHGIDKRNTMAGDYTGMVFYYLDTPEGRATLADVATRGVTDPVNFVLVSSLTSLPVAGSWAAWLQTGESAKVSSKDNSVQYASIVRNVSLTERAGDTFVGDGLPTLILRVEVPKSGDYTISVAGLSGPKGAKLQLRVRDEPVGNIIDFYSPKRTRIASHELATVHFAEGENLLYLTMPGKNPHSDGTRVDLIALYGRRL